MSKSRGTAVAVMVAACVATIAPATVASAVEPNAERDEYVAKAEPICKANVLANKRIFENAKREVKNGELKKASSHFLRAATAFGKTIRQLKEIPRPVADEAKLEKWFELLDTEKRLVGKIGRALKAEDKRKAESISVELNRNSNKTNNAVLSFGFDYCRIEPSRFG